MEASYTIWLPPLFVTSAAGPPRCTRAARVLGDGNRSLLDRGCVHFSAAREVHRMHAKREMMNGTRPVREDAVDEARARGVRGGGTRLQLVAAIQRLHQAAGREVCRWVGRRLGFILVLFNWQLYATDGASIVRACSPRTAAASKWCG